MLADRLQILFDNVQSPENDHSRHEEYQDELLVLDKMLGKIEERKHNRHKYRILANVLSFTLVYLLTSNAIIPLVKVLTMSNRPTEDLGNAIKELIPENLNIDGIVTDNLLMTAWDFNHRTPRIFTKWSYANVHTKKQEYRLTLREMTHASANTQYYFFPFEIPDRYKQNEGKPYIYLSGDNVAMSPAMYAILEATNKKNIDPNDIKLISVGSVNAEPEKLGDQTSLLEWAVRLSTLTAPVKMHTMDYMSE